MVGNKGDGGIWCQRRGRNCGFRPKRETARDGARDVLYYSVPEFVDQKVMRHEMKINQNSPVRDSRFGLVRLGAQIPLRPGPPGAPCPPLPSSPGSLELWATPSSPRCTGALHPGGCALWGRTSVHPAPASSPPPLSLGPGVEEAFPPVENCLSCEESDRGRAWRGPDAWRTRRGGRAWFSLALEWPRQRCLRRPSRCGLLGCLPQRQGPSSNCSNQTLLGYGKLVAAE